MAQLTLSQAHLFGACYEIFLYGINVALIIIMLSLSARRKNASRAQYIRAVSIFCVFALCTVHLAMDLRSFRIAVFESPSPDAFFEDHAQFVDLVQNISYAAATILADGFLIHRLYVVSADSWKTIILPCMSLLATFVTSIVSIGSPSDITLHTHMIATFTLTAFVLNLFTNILITMMIFVHIVLAIRDVRGCAETQSLTRCFLACLVESGLVYPLSLLVTGALLLFKSSGFAILAVSNIQLLCIVLLLLALQVRLDLSIYEAAEALRGSSGSATSLGSVGPSHAWRRSPPPPPRMLPSEDGCPQTDLPFRVRSWHPPDWRVDLHEYKDTDGISRSSVLHITSEPGSSV